MNIESQLRAIAKKRTQDVDSIVRISVQRLANRITTDTPVANGFLINSWNTTINGIGHDKRDASTSGTESRKQLSERVESFNIGEYITFSNPMPYGPRIEYEGHSEKAKHGMVRVNTALWDTIVTEEINKRK